MSSDDEIRLARVQRLLDMLEQVTKQANDLSRMAGELRQEAAESIRLVKAAERKPSGSKRKKKRTAS